VEVDVEQQAAVEIATKMKDAMTKIEEAIDYMRANVESNERAPLTRAIGEIFAIMTDQIYSRLVKANPQLHDVLFRGLPKDTPDRLLGRTQS
jgi:hypothetical protein